MNRRGRLGVHSPAAMDNDTNFRIANRVAAPVVTAAGAVAVVLAIVLLALSWSTVTSIVIAVVGLAGVVALMVAGGVLGERAARSLPVPARKPAGGGGCGGCACGGGGCAGLTRTDPAATGSA
nr:SdpI family protein [Nakamurella flavida]